MRLCLLAETLTLTVYQSQNLPQCAHNYNTLMFVDNADHDIVGAGYCGQAPNDEDSC